MGAYGNLLATLKAAAAVADPLSAWDTGTNLEEYQNREISPLIFLLPVTATEDFTDQLVRLVWTYRVQIAFIARDQPDFNSERSDRILDERGGAVSRFLHELNLNVQNGVLLGTADISPVYREYSLCFTGWLLTFEATVPEEILCQ